MSGKTMAEVLAEHFYHNADFGGIGGRWSIECNCDEVTTADSHADAEAAFVAHQAMELANAGYGDIRAARAGALDDAAEEIDRLRVIGKTPYSECTEYEARAWWAFAEVKPEAWLRTRAVDVRGDS